MTYQANFTFLTPPRAKTLLQGILAKVALGQFVLSRTPSTKPASQQATCPYLPYHVIYNGQNYAAEAVAGQQLTGRPAVLTPAYLTNPGLPDLATAAQEYVTLAADMIGVSPRNSPAMATTYPAQPASVAPSYSANVPEEATTNPSVLRRAVDGAFTYAGEPAPGAATEPAKPAAPEEQLPAKKTECR